MNDGQDVRKKVTKHIAMNLTVEFVTLVSTWAVSWCHGERSLDGGFERLMESQVKGIVVLGLQHSVCPYVKLLEVPLFSTERLHIAWFSFYPRSLLRHLWLFQCPSRYGIIWHHKSTVPIFLPNIVFSKILVSWDH